MRAVIIRHCGDLAAEPSPLALTDLPVPVPGDEDVVVRVSVCGVCHTELDQIAGRLTPPRLPVIPGHQAVGRVVGVGSKVASPSVGDRVGVGWIRSACGRCGYCRSERENLCPQFQATGRDADGGYAEYVAVPAAFVHPIPASLTDRDAAPLLCAGAIGYRSLRLAGLRNGEPLGLTGFGASGHLVLKLARHRLPDSPVVVFARNPEERAFARSLGAVWAGVATDRPPMALQAIIDTTPVWGPVVEALECLAPGSRLVINAIRKENADQDQLRRIDYPRHLWLEKEIKSVANVTRADIRECLELAAEVTLVPEVEEYPFDRAAEALIELATRGVRGAKVLRIAE
jgi:propanol-preferring alcohol dehydrogenase